MNRIAKTSSKKKHKTENKKNNTILSQSSGPTQTIGNTTSWAMSLPVLSQVLNFGDYLHKTRIAPEGQQNQVPRYEKYGQHMDQNCCQGADRYRAWMSLSLSLSLSANHYLLSVKPGLSLLQHGQGFRQGSQKDTCDMLSIVDKASSDWRTRLEICCSP